MQMGSLAFAYKHRNDRKNIFRLAIQIQHPRGGWLKVYMGDGEWVYQSQYIAMYTL